MISKGTRNINWRERDKKMDFLIIPMLSKNIVVTIWKPTIGYDSITIRIPLADCSIRFLSSVKAVAIIRGNNSPDTNPIVVINVAHIMAIFSVFNEREYCLAP